MRIQLFEYSHQAGSYGDAKLTFEVDDEIVKKRIEKAMLVNYDKLCYKFVTGTGEIIYTLNPFLFDNI